MGGGLGCVLGFVSSWGGGVQVTSGFFFVVVLFFSSFNFFSLLFLVGDSWGSLFALVFKTNNQLPNTNKTTLKTFLATEIDRRFY